MFWHHVIVVADWLVVILKTCHQNLRVFKRFVALSAQLKIRRFIGAQIKYYSMIGCRQSILVILSKNTFDGGWRWVGGGGGWWDTL